ncbi:mucin-4 isoform X3 [Columba livia]|uniref:mucin-4 isoform X3 n=1 Tax=Columba livia TaxID=8932 RepID=UPI0031BAC620
MGTRRWTTSTFVGCCIWILHGLRAAGAIPVTTEGSFAAGTVSPIATESEGPPALVMGTAETSTTVANAEIAESILAGSSSSLSFPAGAQTDALVTATIAYGSTALTLINVTKPLNTSQENKGGSAAPTAATSTAAIPEQYPAVTPEAALDVTGAVPTAPLGTTPLFAGVKEDVPAAVTREEAENLDPTVSDVLFPTLPAVTWGAQPAAGSPVGAGVTVLPSQGVTTGTGAVKEDTTRLVGFQTEDSANSWSPSAGRLITNQQDGMLSRAGGIAPEPEGETAPAAEESPSALVPGARGDAVNGEFSTAGSSLLSPESTTVASPGEPSILPSQAALSPAASLAPAGDGDRDGQGAPGLSSEGSTLSPAAIEAPAAPEVTEDMATSLLDPSVPTDAQSDTNPPVLDTVLPTEDVGTMGLTKPSLQPAPWQIPIGEQPPLLASALPPPTDNSSALRAAYPPSGAGASTLPAAGDGAETGTSPDLAAASGTPVSPSLGGSQPWGITAGAPQGANGPGTGSSSASDVPSPASFIPDGLAWPAAGVQGQRAEGPGDIAQAGGPGDDSLYADIQSDTSRSAFSTQQDAANTGELPAGETEALANAKLSPPSAVGDRAGAAPAQGQVPPPGPASLGSAGLQPDLSGAEGPGDLPSEFPSAPGAVYPPLGSAAGPVSGAETPVSPDLSAAQGAPVSPSFEEPQPWGTAAGAPQGAGLPGASGPGTVLTSAWDVPNSAVNGPAGPPSPALRDQFGTNPGLPAVEGQGPGTTEPVLGGAGSGTEFEPSLISAAGGGTVVGVNQLPGAGSLSGPASRSDVVATSSTSEDNRAGLIPAAAPVPDSLSSASPDSETGPGLAQVLGADGTGNAVQAGNPESERPYTETSPSAFSAQQDPSNTGELPAGETGALVNTELSPSLAPGDRAGTGAAPALGQVSPPGPASLGSAGLQPDLSGAEGPEDLPSEFPNAPGAAYPPLGSAAGPVLGAETPVSPDLSAAQGAPVSPSFEEPQPWGAAAGAPQGAGLPGASGPGTVLTSAWDVPNSAVYGPAGSPSPALGDQFGTHPGLPAVEGHGTGTAELMLGGAGSGTEFEPSLISAAGGGTAAGVNQLPGAGSLSGPASHSDAVATSSLLDTASPSALGGAGSTPGALQPSLGAGPGVPPAAGEGAGEAAGDGTSLGQTAAEGQPAGSGAPDREAAAVLQSASTSSTVGSSSPGTAANGANLPGAGEASNGLSTGLEAAGPEEPPVSAPGIQSGADLGLSDARLSQVNVVDLPGGALADRGPSSSASLGEGAGPIIQTTSGVSAPSAFASPQGTQPLLPVAPGAGGVSDGTATSLPASLLLPGHGLTSGLAPNGDPHFVPSTQSGSAPLALGAPGGLAGDAGGAQLWSSEDEVASGMPAPSGEASPRAPTSPNAAPVLPSALEGESSAEGVSAGPGLSALPAIPLYGYGARENDREYVERKVDFNSPLFKPETGFPFGNTLRSSLYFTDNGQIIFPASDNSIFTYPNPPPRGFSGREEVPMIAVFWDNADFSRGVGTTFYQEFPTLNTDKPPFVRDVEAKVRRYLRSSYSAAWTLKITWEKAPAYGARTDTRRTITYQAVLTTDGFRSYVLMLYQAGGMQWDYTRLAATNVLIGYTSGDGFYRNDDLTRRPPAAKYRPDQFRGYNTDLRGLWIYKLESRVGINYRLKCLAWTGQQQEPRMWSQGLPACPCTLQQGQRDPRFKSSRGGWGAARVSMLHSASPNPYGAGVRCLYDSQSRLIEGRQERYWRFFRQASPFRDQELKLYDWCCNQAGSAHLCARYSEKRPKIGCDGYQSPGTGSSEEEDSNSKEQGDREDK